MVREHTILLHFVIFVCLNSLPWIYGLGYIVLDIWSPRIYGLPWRMFHVLKNNTYSVDGKSVL